MTIEATDPNENTFADFLAARKLSFSYDFVPFSKSRNAGEKHKSLNWKVTFKRDGRDVITTDYSAGEAHCPAYKRTVADGTVKCPGDKRLLVAWECENGKEARYLVSVSYISGKKPILPKDSDVMNSLLLDSDVLNYASFENWADEFGYESDSRAAEKTYNACLQIALALKNAFSPNDFDTLREMFANQ